MDNYSYSAETADAARSPNVMLGQCTKGLTGNPVDLELREKALMYAMQTYGHSLDSFSVLNIAEDYLVFLRGDAK